MMIRRLSDHRMPRPATRTRRVLPYQLDENMEHAVVVVDRQHPKAVYAEARVATVLVHPGLFVSWQSQGDVVPGAYRGWAPGLRLPAKISGVPMGHRGCTPTCASAKGSAVAASGSSG